MPQKAAKQKPKRVKLSKSLRLHIRRLKAEGRIQEADALAQKEVERKQNAA